VSDIAFYLLQDCAVHTALQQILWELKDLQAKHNKPFGARSSCPALHALPGLPCKQAFAALLAIFPSQQSGNTNTG